jgi:general L-amino acid transport system substrate-binding protein
MSCSPPFPYVAGVVGLLTTLAACTGQAPGRDPAVPVKAEPATATPTLDGVRRKGFVQCGVSTGIAGFSAPDKDGAWRGLDVDVCRAIAAAVLGNASKVRFTPLSTAQRFTALQTGEIDVLTRNTTISFLRVVLAVFVFPVIYLYVGCSFMVVV